MSYVANGLRPYMTLSDENQFSFTCPIFDAKAKMKDCMNLREIIWKGHAFEKRKGCQAAMQTCKCPINNIIKRLGDKDYGDAYGSKVEKHGQLRKDDLERILPVICDARDMERHDCNDIEKARMLGANERIKKQIGSSRAPSTYVDMDDEEETIEIAATPAPKPKRAPKSNAANEAAKRGDISAAINASLAA